VNGLRWTVTLFTVFLLLPIAGCGKKGSAPVNPEPQVTVSCIGVLPARSVVDYDDTVSFARAKRLQEGTQLMNRLLRQHFQGNSRIRFVNDDQVAGLIGSGSETTLELHRKIAAQVSCNAILEVTLREYADRVGGQYSASRPASVAFDYRLIETGNGAVLCRGTFEEEQKSLMENLYNLKTASRRGFTWITGEQLMQEGLAERFSECSYLQTQDR